AVDHALGVCELERPSHVAPDAHDVGLGERSLALEPRGERVGAQVHGEVDEAPGARHEADADDVRVLELGSGFGFVAEPALELGVAGIARHEDLDRDRRPVQLPTREHPGEPALAERSEERRVGKECYQPCRSRWWPVPLKKKITATGKASHISAANITALARTQA